MRVGVSEAARARSGDFTLCPTVRFSVLLGRIAGVQAPDIFFLVALLPAADSCT